MIERGGVYYEIFEREDKHTNLIVLFFEDSLIDVTAEVMNLKANLMDFDCLLNFKAYARDHLKASTLVKCTVSHKNYYMRRWTWTL